MILPYSGAVLRCFRWNRTDRVAERRIDGSHGLQSMGKKGENNARRVATLEKLGGRRLSIVATRRGTLLDLFPVGLIPRLPSDPRYARTQPFAIRIPPKTAKNPAMRVSAQRAIALDLSLIS